MPKHGGSVAGSCGQCPDDPMRADGFRDGTNAVETQREAAQLPGHVQHDAWMGAAAGVCTLVFASVGITVRQP